MEGRPSEIGKYLYGSAAHFIVSCWQLINLSLAKVGGRANTIYSVTIDPRLSHSSLWQRVKNFNGSPTATTSSRRREPVWGNGLASEEPTSRSMTGVSSTRQKRAWHTKPGRHWQYEGDDYRRTGQPISLSELPAPIPSEQFQGEPQMKLHKLIALTIALIFLLLASASLPVALAQDPEPDTAVFADTPNACKFDGWTCTQKFYNNYKQCIGKVTSPEKHNFTMSSGNTCSNASTCSTKKINTTVVNGKRVCPWSFTYN